MIIGKSKHYLGNYSKIHYYLTKIRFKLTTPDLKFDIIKKKKQNMLLKMSYLLYTFVE